MPLDPDRSGPTTIGVVGHRDLVPGDRERLRPVVARFLDMVGLHRGKIEILTGAAEGADLLVAREAVERGLPVHAVLPMPVAHYHEDFTGEGRAELDRLLGHPLVEVSVLESPAPGRAPDPRGGSGRNRFYAALADHVIARADVLLALWDGSANGLPGGTGDVVLRYLGGPAGYAGPVVLEDGSGTTAEGRVVAWVPVRRTDDAPVPDPTIRWLSPGVAQGRVVVADPPHGSDDRAGGSERGADSADLPADATDVPTLMAGVPDTIAPGMRAHARRLAEAFDTADRRATANQRRSDRVFAVLGVSAGVMGLLFLVYAKVRADAAYLVGYLALMVGSYGVYLVASRREWFRRHLAERVAAESLRVRFHLALAGVEHLVDPERLAGLTGVSSLVGLEAPAAAVPSSFDTDGDDALLDHVRTSWVEDQAEYFRARVGRLAARQRRLERVRGILFAMAFAAGVGLLAFSKDLGTVELAPDLDLKTLVLLLMGVLPLWLGIWEIYQDKMAMRELAWQYGNQAAHFDEAASSLVAAASREERRRILAELGERSLFEVHLWALHRFHREFEASLPG